MSIWSDPVLLGGGGGGTTILKGTDPPPNNIGNNGDVYLRYWNATILAPGYTQLFAVRSTGSQYIDTGVTPDTNTSFEIDDLVFHELYTEWNSVLGEGTVSGRIWAFRFNGRNSRHLHFQVGLDSTQVALFQPDPDVIYQVSGSNGSVVINGTVYTGTAGTLTNPMNTLGLFGYVTNELFTNVQLGACRIYDNGALVRNFIPAMRDSDQKVGMYDLQNAAFYVNGGSGNLIGIGPEDGEIFEAYVKINGVWTSLVGANIEDVD